MQCPRCDEALQVHAIEEVEIDECRKCDGLWFQKGEVQAAKDAAAPDLRWLDFEIWKHADRYRLSVLPVVCPNCKIPMVAVSYGDTDVEVDYCPKCQGVWLDEGEFGKIISALTEEVATKSISDYVKASLEEAAEVVTGPESRVSEWRDLAAVFKLFQYRLLAENPRLSDTAAHLQRVAAGF
jgi:Zn-finger nucleic acid-binding protein